VNPKYELAVCCKVEVVKGALGFLETSVSLISIISKLLLFSVIFSTLSTSVLSKISPGYFSEIIFPVLSFVSAEIFQ